MCVDHRQINLKMEGMYCRFHKGLVCLKRSSSLSAATGTAHILELWALWKEI